MWGVLAVLLACGPGGSSAIDARHLQQQPVQPGAGYWPAEPFATAAQQLSYSPDAKNRHILYRMPPASASMHVQTHAVPAPSQHF